LQKAKHTTTPKRVLLISDFDHFLIDGLKSELQKNDVQIKHLFMGTMGNKSRFKFLFNMFFSFLYILFQSKKYDCVSYHYATKYLILVDIAARLKRMRRVCTIWGSEFTKASSKNREQLLSWYSTLNALSVTNKNFISSLSGHKINVHETSFGLSQFRHIDNNRQKTSTLKTDKINIVVGTNGSSNQQHLEILKQLAFISDDDLSKYHFIFPMSYGGNNAYRNLIKSEATNININFSTIERVLNEDELSLLRLNTDILLQLQVTDQLSGAMLESIFAGAHIITGSWLPYETLDVLNLKWSKIDSLNELPEKIGNIHSLTNEEKKENKVVMGDGFSWEYRIKNWLCFLVET